MLGKFKHLFLSLALIFSLLIGSVAQASMVFVCRDTASNQTVQVQAKNKAQALLACEQELSTNTLSFTVTSVVNAGSRFSGDLYSNISVPRTYIPLHNMSIDSYLGVDVSFLHDFASFWSLGVDVNTQPLALTMPAGGGRMRLRQFASDVLIGRRIYASTFVKLRLLFELGAFYYRTTDAYLTLNNVNSNYVRHSGFGLQYGGRLEAILCGWTKTMQPILSISYLRSSQINLVSLIHLNGAAQEFPLSNKPNFTESVLTFGVGAAFMM